MKNLNLSFLFFFFFLSIGNFAFAQRFEAGVIGGFNMTQLDGDLLGGYNQIGINAGAKVDAVINDRWRLMVEMIYSQQGSARDTNDPFAGLSKIRLNFVEAPVLIAFRDWKFQVATGLSYGRLINYKVIDLSGADVTDSQNYATNIISWAGDLTFFFKENLGLNVRWAKNLNSIKADNEAGRLIGRIISIRGIYMF